jgi:outer membrane protein OmpA-like peptidoglycan-associated protein
MISKYRKILNGENSKDNFWPTFTDMMTTILMLVILILFSTEAIAGSLEQDIAKNVDETLKETLKDVGIPIFIDNKTGSITFGDSALFDTDSDELKEEAKDMLKLFIPKYIAAIYKEYSQNVSKIIVEGYTDDVGSYIYNLDLSQRRAYSVVKYIIGDEIGEYEYKDMLIEDLVAIGRSKSELILNDDNSVNRDLSRRVEIKYEIDVP